jgi:hypothetical protein
MKNGEILIYAPGAVGKPNRDRKKAYLTAIGAFLQFCQRNGLVHKVFVARNETTAPISVVVQRSAFTDNGFKVYNLIYAKWITAVEKGEVSHEDTTLLDTALARVRSGRVDQRKNTPIDVAPRKIIPKRAKTGSRQEHSQRIPSTFKLTNKEQKEFEAAGPQVYDKAEWHLEKLPSGFDSHQAYVHTGLYIRWLIEMNFVTDEFLKLARLNKRQILKGSQVYNKWDGVLASDMLTPIGNQFTRYYYEGDYLFDFERRLARNLPSPYDVEESDENYELIKGCIKDRFKAWQARSSKNRRNRLRGR